VGETVSPSVWPTLQGKTVVAARTREVIGARTACPGTGSAVVVGEVGSTER